SHCPAPRRGPVPPSLLLNMLIHGPRLFRVIMKNTFPKWWQRHAQFSFLGSIFLCVASVLSVPCNAQTNDAPTTPALVFTNLGSYFTDINTNLSWASTPFSVWTGANYQSGVNTSAELGLSYDAFKPAAAATATTTLAVAPEAVVRNAGIAG